MRTAAAQAGMQRGSTLARGSIFVVADQGAPDTLLHANVLGSFGRSAVADGSTVIGVLQTEHGMQSVAMISIEPPETVPSARLADPIDLDPALLASQLLEPARVRWFDDGEGVDLATQWISLEDAFVHVEELRRSGFADLATGEVMGLGVIDGKCGRMAIEVAAWDASARKVGDRGRGGPAAARRRLVERGSSRPRALLDGQVGERAEQGIVQQSPEAPPCGGPIWNAPAYGPQVASLILCDQR